MSSARVFAVLAFVLAYVSQPLALDACAISCEAARAARSAVVAAPCHHSSSCATQITQPTTPGSTVACWAIVPGHVLSAADVRVVSMPHAPSYHPPQAFSPPPIPLRV